MEAEEIAKSIISTLLGGYSVSKAQIKECEAKITEALQAQRDQGRMFKLGDKVRKIGGDYTFEGIVVSVFKKLSGKERFVVEDDRGVLHIYSDKNLEAIN